MTSIHRADKKISYTLYPNSKKYIVHAQTEGKGNDHLPTIEKTKVGTEIIDKHPTEKYKVRMVYSDGKVEEGFIWNATDLDEMTIKSEVENSDLRTTSELRKILLKTPAPPLFEIPADYTEAQNLIELMTTSQ
jgi:hypothetical protein